jgi:hypothetical protein
MSRNNQKLNLIGGQVLFGAIPAVRPCEKTDALPRRLWKFLAP